MVGDPRAAVTRRRLPRSVRDAPEVESDRGVRSSRERDRKRDVKSGPDPWVAVDDDDADDELADALILPVADVEEPSIGPELSYVGENGLAGEVRGGGCSGRRGGRTRR